MLCTFLFFSFWWQCNLEIANLVCQTGGVFHFGCCICLCNAILEILSLLFVLVALLVSILGCPIGCGLFLVIGLSNLSNCS